MFKLTLAKLGISIGALISILFGLVYIVVLHEPGSAFYPFAGLAFLGGPLVGGIIAIMKTPNRSPKSFLTSSGVIFGIVFSLLVLTYAVLPQFARTNVQLPAFCDGFDGSLNPLPHLTYTLPDRSPGILITSDARTAVVAMIGVNHPPFPSAVFLVNKSNNKIIQHMNFGNDVMSAAIDKGIVYIFNDKLGYIAHIVGSLVHGNDCCNILLEY